jgi:hypothetical protein
VILNQKTSSSPSLPVKLFSGGVASLDSALPLRLDSYRHTGINRGPSSEA